MIDKDNNRDKEKEIAILNKLSKLAEKNNYINQDLYTRFNVKRGLRNADGSGVLVGLTEIGNVHGYIVDENEIVPVEGELRYRGINVFELVEGFQKDNRFGFEETSYLLLFGELPSKKELDDFKELLDNNRDLPEGFKENMILKAPSSDVMNKLARSVLASYSYDSNSEEGSIKNNLRQSIELIGRFPTMIAYAYQAKAHYFDGKSLFLHNPKKGLSTAENFLRLIRSNRSYTKLEAEILDLCLVLHAEHGGGNNSAFTIHVVSSSDTDIYSAISSAVGSLKGKKHGGANNQVIDMMSNIKKAVKDWNDEDEIVNYLEKIIKKEAFDRSGLIYGMGHAVYTKSDPRAHLLKEKARSLARAKGREDELTLHENIEKLVPKVFERVKKSSKIICANVDFYSGFVYSMLDIPRELNTPLFAMARIAGWAAHRLEELTSGGRIIRPAYKNVSEKREYKSLTDR